MKSREISKESSICQTRLFWWEQTIADVTERKKPARDPVSRVIQEAVQRTPLNPKILKRLINYQLFDIERGDI
jgi:phytoene/squalene synthetase